MKGIGRREKCYVEVLADFSEDGRVTPLEIVWEDGRRFGVDRVIDGRWASNMKLGGTGYRYTVMVGGKERFLWRDGERWYVERIVPDAEITLVEPGSLAWETGADSAVWCFEPA